MCTKTLPPVTLEVISGSTTAHYTPITGWLPAMSVRSIKFLNDFIARTGNLQVRVAIQTATTDTDSPSSWIPKGTWLDTTGKSCSGMVDISADVDAGFFVRIGLGVKNSAGSAMERGEVAVAISTSAA